MMEECPQPVSPRPSAKTQALKWLLPAAFTGAAIFYLVSTIDIKDVIDKLDARAAWILFPALLAYGAVSLLIEALSLKRPLHVSADFTVITAARVKAASYLLGFIHYAFGIGTLSILLRRQAGVGLAEAAGIVMLLMMFDLGMLLVMVAIGATLISTSAVQLQFGMILGVISLIVSGFAFLRAPFPMGPFDKLRDLEIFRAARSIPTRQLVELGALRLVFVLSFELLGWAALTAFSISVPFPDLLVNFSAVALVATLPAVAGIGPSQVAMVEFFREFASRESILACSIALAAGMIVMRATIGIVFAGEFSREAYSVAREYESAAEEEA